MPALSSHAQFTDLARYGQATRRSRTSEPTATSVKGIPRNAENMNIVNGDGRLGGQDAAQILKFYAGITTCFPADGNCNQLRPKK